MAKERRTAGAPSDLNVKYFCAGAIMGEFWKKGTIRDYLHMQEIYLLVLDRSSLDRQRESPYCRTCEDDESQVSYSKLSFVLDMQCDLTNNSNDPESANSSQVMPKAIFRPDSNFLS